VSERRKNRKTTSRERLLDELCRAHDILERSGLARAFARAEYFRMGAVSARDFELPAGVNKKLAALARKLSPVIDLLADLNDATGARLSIAAAAEWSSSWEGDRDALDVTGGWLSDLPQDLLALRKACASVRRAEGAPEGEGPARRAFVSELVRYWRIELRRKAPEFKRQRGGEAIPNNEGARFLVRATKFVEPSVSIAAVEKAARRRPAATGRKTR